MQRIKRDLNGRYHDERGRFIKVDLTPEEYELLSNEIRLNRINERTYERASSEFIFEEKRKPDEVFFNVAAGGLFVYLIFEWVSILIRY